MDRWDEGDVLDVAGARFARQMTKPIHFGDLMQAVREILSERRTSDADAGRAAARIAAVREKVKVMTNEELNALAQVLRRRGEDLKEEVHVITEIINGRQANVRQQHPFPI
jgi:hypothetical protein